MEPIVLIGLVVVCYGGYIAVLDLWNEVSALLPRRPIKKGSVCGHRDRGLEAPVKKMAGMYV